MPTKMVISPSSTCIPKHLVNLMMIRGRVTAQPAGAADPSGHAPRCFHARTASSRALQKEAAASVVTKLRHRVRLSRFTILQLHRRHKMSDPEPSQWQITLTVMENIREVQRRADS